MSAPSKRELVCGGRHYQDWRRVADTLRRLHDSSPIGLIIHGVTRGPLHSPFGGLLGFVMWPPIARLVRGQALGIREMRATGGKPMWIIRRHVWPGVLPVVAAQFATSVSFAIFTSASLRFLGLGIPPPAADWGGMVRAGYDYLAINPWMSLAPGAAVSLTVMGFYVIGRSFR
jgi:ABC-type dipeptide/oligopeptide/nickel transport system permease subunit